MTVRFKVGLELRRALMKYRKVQKSKRKEWHPRGTKVKIKK